ncbi:hypothetical protein GUJ93_ZPchr0007g4573 [Zizania palustris]|uniref:Uncharacterized protein n=1 Tax=Zizania palustris TaxID=103762 RepID=A0A8J5SR59_ZIZPA|nr:hypothetical protein GUJ93_ZPchr0007g4573 [Zizania palustris]KAG8080590.1 hypothetical protein GUJ93_ZPchr0007g4573 [Zizania palustris]KAG8080591.1 hypothetical protein GUJ93_ZPchr0007g4573 [Zizania palustris]
MSGAPKRLHEEGSHSTPVKRPLDDSSLYSSPSGKLIQPGSGDFHGSFEHDGRFSKVQRVESHDDKRPSLAHRMPIGLSSFVDHPISSDGRLESKQSKDSRDTKVELREAKSDSRDVYSDSRIEFPGNKVETDVKTDNRTDDSEIRAERRMHADYKGDVKLDKDGHPTAISNIAWKDNKEHRGKRNSEQPGDNAEWRFPRHGLQGTVESSKVPISAEERSKDSHESTGENKTEPKTEDNGVEWRENQREDKDAEKWDRERKESQKGKEGNDREKDSTKESSVTTEKENPILEKAASDGAVKSVEHENKTIESKIIKDDAWKSHDTDPKDKKREKDVDAGERHQQRSKYNDKESDDTCHEGDIDKDKEALGSVQHKRMVRSRGGSQASQREPRFRSRMRDGEGSQVKSEKFAYQQRCTSTNRQVKGAQLWGTDIYTNDSDLVAVLMHTGYCSPTSSPPPSAIQELRATVRVLPPQDSYTSTLRNNVRSRAWGAGIGCSFRIECCCIVKKGGVERTMTTRAAASNALRQQRFVREVTIQYNLCNEPWLKYSISIVADKGLKKTLYTSTRLKKGEVIYLETHYNRYELCFGGEKARSVGSSSIASDAEPEKHHSSSHHHTR